MNRKIRESGENRSQIIPHWKFQTTAAFHHRKDGRYFGSGLCAADVDPVLSSDCDRSCCFVRWTHFPIPAFVADRVVASCRQITLQCQFAQGNRSPVLFGTSSAYSFQNAGGLQPPIDSVSF